METKQDPTIATTLFVNVDNEPYTIIINGKEVRTFGAGESGEVVIYAAQVGTKHLVDRILHKRGMQYISKEDKGRQDLFSQILPKLAEVLDIKPLSDEERKKEMDKMLRRNDEILETFKAEVKAQNEEARKKDEKKDKKIEELTKLVEALVADKKSQDLTTGLVEKKKPGRPKKVENN